MQAIGMFAKEIVVDDDPPRVGHHQDGPKTDNDLTITLDHSMGAGTIVCVLAETGVQFRKADLKKIR